MNNDVNTFPVFPGKEKHYLKAQLSRITFSSTLAPGGVYKVVDDNDRETQLDPEFAFPGREELYTIEKWVHQHPQILKTGRTTYYVPKGLDEEAAAEYKQKQEDAEPLVERLRVVTEDTRNFFNFFFK